MLYKQRYRIQVATLASSYLPSYIYMTYIFKLAQFYKDFILSFGFDGI